VAAFVAVEVNLGVYTDPIGTSVRDDFAVADPGPGVAEFASGMPLVPCEVACALAVEAAKGDCGAEDFGVGVGGRENKGEAEATEVGDGDGDGVCGRGNTVVRAEVGSGVTCVWAAKELGVGDGARAGAGVTTGLGVGAMTEVDGAGDGTTIDVLAVGAFGV
jgi:hypothetical protein